MNRQSWMARGILPSTSALRMPLCKAGLATVGLFIALNYWNDWYNAMLFLDEGRSRNLYPLAILPEQYPDQGAGDRTPAAARSGIPAERRAQRTDEAGDDGGAPQARSSCSIRSCKSISVKGVTIGAVKG